MHLHNRVDARAVLSLFLFCAGATGRAQTTANPAVVIEKITVDGRERPVPRNGALQLPAGRHRVDFTIRLDDADPEIPMRMRCTLEGFEDEWRDLSDSMLLEAQFLNAAHEVLSEQRFLCTGVTPGFRESWERTSLQRRREPLLVPPDSAFFRLRFSSGNPSTTGLALLDDLTLNLPGGSLSPTHDLWQNSGFSALSSAPGEEMIADRWRRQGTKPSIARMARGPNDLALSLADDDPAAYGEWVSELPLDERVKAGETLSLEWRTAWMVPPGRRHHVSYQGVGAGDYQLRVTAISQSGGWTGASTSLEMSVGHQWWEYPWFWPVVAGVAATLFGAAGFLLWHQRMQRRLDRLAAQHTLERDRARIARDMHDDLGARLTRITVLTALTERELASGNRADALAHAGQLSGLAREVVGAIDEIVWAVNPENDTLDHLGTYLCRFADEFFSGSAVRCRFGIPPVLPAVPLSSEVRHHLFLAVKEALNNILKHASPCEARLELNFTGRELHIDVSDTGPGFPAGTGLSGNGLRNMERRLQEIGGTCTITSEPAGTHVSLHWLVTGKK